MRSSAKIELMKCTTVVLVSCQGEGNKRNVVSTERAVVVGRRGVLRCKQLQRTLSCVGAVSRWSRINRAWLVCVCGLGGLLHVLVRCSHTRGTYEGHQPTNHVHALRLVQLSLQFLFGRTALVQRNAMGSWCISKREKEEGVTSSDRCKGDVKPLEDCDGYDM